MPVRPTAPTALTALLRLSAALVCVGALAGCPAVFPELGTRTRALPAGQPLDPPPPEGIRWIRVLSARVPEKTRGGRPWQANGKLADPYTKIFINDKEVFRTAVQPNTLEPTWPNGPSGNFKFGRADRLGVELWDSNAINDQPICVKDVGRIDDEQRMDKQVRARCEDLGAEVMVAFEEAHAVIGAGLWYELRTETCFVTRMLQGSPAERVGIRPGDEIVDIRGRNVRSMTYDEIRSEFNAISINGLPLLVKHTGGSTESVTLKEGPIYPLYEQFGPVN
jgi:hypothetical protein